MDPRSSNTVPLASAENVAPAAPKSFTRFFPTIGRVLMGLMFFVFGLNGFFNFIPQPKDPVPENAMAFVGALMATGYMLKLIKGTEVLVGVLLLANRFVPLALAFIAPVIVNIVAFHTILAPSGAPMAYVILALELYLAWCYRNAFRPMLVARAVPASATK
jgi:uncharacterized membrane protein YphA (DoxX/SURF4 family)